ncbi:Isy1-like splicing family protein [Ostertagia ostertagi]
MARNAEKAMTALARWRRLKEKGRKDHIVVKDVLLPLFPFPFCRHAETRSFQGPIAKRPHDTSLCSNLDDAERFRREIAKEIAKKIALIQNPGLGEFKIRDLNDEINKMIRIKYAWEMRIRELGGMDYRKISARELDKEGREVASNRGYKYFGAAKDLPGVRELFEESKELEQMRKTRAELMKHVDADYYGYLDDDDGLLIPLEKEEEKRAIEQAEKVSEFQYFAEHGAERFQKEFGDDMDEDIYKIRDDSDGEDIDTKESIVVGEDGKQMTI